MRRPYVTHTWDEFNLSFQFSHNRDNYLYVRYRMYTLLDEEFVTGVGLCWNPLGDMESLQQWLGTCRTPGLLLYTVLMEENKSDDRNIVAADTLPVWKTGDDPERAVQMTVREVRDFVDRYADGRLPV